MIKEDIKIRGVSFFSNGTIGVFDKKGEQISKYQGCILDADIKDISKYCNEDTDFYFVDWNTGFSCPINLEWWFNRKIKKEANNGK
jgi:hypothetical protein